MQAAWLAAVLLTVPLAGCAAPRGVRLRRDTPSLAERWGLTTPTSAQPSPRTLQVLRRYALEGKLATQPQEVLDALTERLRAEPSLELLHTCAEVSYRRAEALRRTGDPDAINYYGAALVHAYRYLFDPRFGPARNVYDPQFRGACDVYNRSLDQMLRQIKSQQEFAVGYQGRVVLPEEDWDLRVVALGSGWHASPATRYEFVADYELQGLKNHYRGFGLGVPLIGIRRQGDAHAAVEPYYPRDLSFPVTAFLRLLPDQPGQTSHARPRRQAVLELYDPLQVERVLIGGAPVPLETDLSIPLAYFLDHPDVSNLATLNLVDPDKSRLGAGLYMAQPFDPHKIPVIMIHGLWSDPTTWFEMYNDLRSAPELRAHYQFWFYVYPTSEPFWVSAARLREDMRRVRQALGPPRHSPLDRTVLVGHSMGGLVAKMQVIDSGDQLWRLVSDRPPDAIQGDAEVRQRLAGTFLFQANPSVRRIITIGTPHRGADLANSFTQWLSRQAFTLPRLLVKTRDQLLQENPNVLRPEVLPGYSTSIDSLAPDSPILQTVAQTPPAAAVRHHNIVGLLPDDTWLSRWRERGDGVVEFRSAHAPNAVSEVVVEADHVGVHRHPVAVLEVRRILLEHLADGQPAVRWVQDSPRPPGPLPPSR